MSSSRTEQSSTFVFHQLPVVNSESYTAQYHVVVRVTLSSTGDVLHSEVSCFLISYERLRALWPQQDDCIIEQDQESE